MTHPTTAKEPAARRSGPADGDLVGHQEWVTWRGERVLTLASLWPQPLRAVVVGINPAPPSVTEGHYYQGQMGRYALTCLVDIGVLPRPAPGQHLDDAAAAAGIGFTDLVRRPTRSAKDLSAQELRDGAETLRRQIRDRHPGLILAVFAPPVKALLGAGYGAPGLQDATFAGVRVVKLPAQNTRREIAAREWANLGTLWRERFPSAAEGTR